MDVFCAILDCAVVKRSQQRAVQFLLYFSGHGFASSKGSPHVVGTDANAQGAQAVNLKKDFVVPLDKCCDGAAIVLLVDACMIAPGVSTDDREKTMKLNGMSRCSCKLQYSAVHRLSPGTVHSSSVVCMF